MTDHKMPAGSLSGPFSIPTDRVDDELSGEEQLELLQRRFQKLHELVHTRGTTLAVRKDFAEWQVRGCQADSKEATNVLP